jgi:hypothetical protein
MAAEEPADCAGKPFIGIRGELLASCRQEALKRQGDEHKPGKGLCVSPGRNDSCPRGDPACGQRGEDGLFVVIANPVIMEYFRRKRWRAVRVNRRRFERSVIHC